jgi:hypothetical protein
MMDGLELLFTSPPSGEVNNPMPLARRVQPLNNADDQILEDRSPLASSREFILTHSRSAME